MHACPPEGCSSGWKHRNCLQLAACNLSPRKGHVCGRRPERLKDAESREVPSSTDRCDQVGFADHHCIVSPGLRAPLMLLPLPCHSKDSPARSVLLQRQVIHSKRTSKKGPHRNHNQHRGLSNIMHNTLQTSTSKRGRDG